MSWSFKIARLFGIDIKVHLTFLLILVWGAFAYGGTGGPAYGLLMTLSLFSLVALHELGHSLAAMGYGIPVRDISLLPIGGVARLERMPEKPVQELVVALAGPAVNVVLAGALLPFLLGWGLLQPASFSIEAASQPGLIGLLTFLFGANLSLAIFNMLPAFPLDGGRVFRAILGFFTDYSTATRIAAGVGRFIALVLGFLALMAGQIWLALIALFIFIVGSHEAHAVAARHMLRQARVEHAFFDQVRAIPANLTVNQVAPLLLRSSQQEYAVLDPDDGQFLGVVETGRMAETIRQGRGYSRIAEIIERVPVVALNTPLDEAQEKLSQSSSRVAAVYDGLRFRGLISQNDIYHVFRLLSRQKTLKVTP